MEVLGVQPLQPSCHIEKTAPRLAQVHRELVFQVNRPRRSLLIMNQEPVLLDCKLIATLRVAVKSRKFPQRWRASTTCLLSATREPDLELVDQQLAFVEFTPAVIG